MRFGLFAAYPGRNAGGPEMYELELMRGLARIDRDNEYHVFCFDEKAKRTIGIEQDNFQYHILRPSNRALSSLFSLPLQWRKSGCQLLHATFMPPVFNPGPYIFTLVCSSMFEHPELYPPAVRLRLWTLCRLGLGQAKRVICISDDIRACVRNRFNIPDEKMAVIHLAASPMFKLTSLDDRRRVVEEGYGIRDPYFLFSGRWEPRKNILRILEAFARFKQETRLPHKMVFSGLRTWSAEQADSVMDRLGIREHIVDLGKSPVAELPYLYGHAEALVYPSLWEGFGLPIVEAMATGTPVITSNVSSMPEVAGNAAMLVNPQSVEEIADGMRQIATSESLRSSLREKGLRRAKEFSWERTARETLAAYSCTAVN